MLMSDEWSESSFRSSQRMIQPRTSRSDCTATLPALLLAALLMPLGILICLSTLGTIAMTLTPSGINGMETVAFSTSFTWDGDAYKVYELTLPAQPARAVSLILRGKSVIGASPFTINVLISHKTKTPSFAERAFRYVFDSKPPHRKAGKFNLDAARLHKCCEEAAAAAGEANATAACAEEGHELKLWIALKARSLAVASLTVQAEYRNK